jgi:hypothetical protein
MPETKSPTQAQADFSQKQVIRLLLELEQHKRRLSRSGRRSITLAEIDSYAQFLPDATRQFLRAFLIEFLKSEESRLVKALGRERAEIEAAESDATPPTADGRMRSPARAVSPAARGPNPRCHSAGREAQGAAPKEERQ